MKNRFDVTSVIVIAFALATTPAAWAGQEMGLQSAPTSTTQPLPDHDSSTAQGRTGSVSGDGLRVENALGQDIGRVVALAQRGEEIAYLLVEKNGSTGELIPIPVSAAYLDLQKNAVLLLLTDSQLSQAPTLSLDDLQRLNDPDFEEQVHSYYEQQAPDQGRREEGAPPGSSESDRGRAV
jgi:hypothetical protein